MTRGAQWQQVILGAIEDRTCEVFPILNIARAHLCREATQSEAQAIRKAAEQLVIAGKIRVIYYEHPSAIGKRMLAQLCVTRTNSTICSQYCSGDLPDWVVWLDGRTRIERRGNTAQH